MIKDYTKIRMGRDITIQCWDKKIIIHKKIDPQCLYSFLKEMWARGDVPYIKYGFPVVVGWNKLYSDNGWEFVGKTKKIVNPWKHFGYE